MAKTKAKGKIHPKYIPPVKTHVFKPNKMPPKSPEILDTPQKEEQKASEQMQVGGSNEELMAGNDDLDMRILIQQEKGETELQSEAMDQRCCSDKEEPMEEKNRHVLSGHDDKEENCYMEGAQVLDTGNNKDTNKEMQGGCFSDVVLSRKDGLCTETHNQLKSLVVSQDNDETHIQEQAVVDKSIGVIDDHVCALGKKEALEQMHENRCVTSWDDGSGNEPANRWEKEEISDMKCAESLNIVESKASVIIDATYSENQQADFALMEEAAVLEVVPKSGSLEGREENMQEDACFGAESCGQILSSVQLEGVGGGCSTEAQIVDATVLESDDIPKDIPPIKHAYHGSKDGVVQDTSQENACYFSTNEDTMKDINKEMQGGCFSDVVLSRNDGLYTKTHNQLKSLVVSQDNDETHIQEQAVVDKSIGMIDDHVCASGKKEALEQMHENRCVTSWDDGSGNEPANRWEKEEISDMKCAESLNIVESKASVIIDATNSENQQADFALMEEAAVLEVVPKSGSLEGREENMQEDACFGAESCGQILSSVQLEGVGGGCSTEAQIVDATVLESDDIPKDIPPIKHAYHGSKVRSVGSHVVRRILPHHAIDHSSRNALSKSGMHIERVPHFYPENACKNESLLKPLAPVSDSYMNFASSSFDNAFKKEITHMNDAQYEDVDATRHSRGINCPDEQSHELDLCAEQVDIWVSKLKSEANRQCLSSAERIAKLQKTLEEQIKINQRYQILSHQEEQKRKREISRYERELHLMDSVLNDYRKAMKEMQKSDAKRARQDKQLEESLYRDHPDGKGKVITVAEWEKLMEERKIKENQNVILESMKNFYLGSVGKLGEHFQKMDMLCSRLSGCQDSLNQLKAKAVGPKSLD